jgi:hypothetical protein
MVWRLAGPTGRAWVGMDRILAGGCRFLPHDPAPYWPTTGSAQRRGEQRAIDHVGLGSAIWKRARRQQALGPLGYQLLIERDGSAGFGR